jgi:hypothetical protein
MSKFTDRLQNISQASVPGIGFRKSASGLKGPPLLLVADLTKAGSKKVKDITGVSIDAAVIKSEDLTVDSFEKLVAATGDVPLGLVLGSYTQNKVPAFVDSGCDFIIFDVGIPLEAVDVAGVGRILRVDPSLAPYLVRAVNGLSFSVDAVLIAGDSISITVERLLLCQLFAELLDKPLLLAVGPSVTSGELNNLCGVGIKGLVLSEGLTGKTYTELKKVIDGLPEATKRKIKADAVVPWIGGKTAVDMEEADEDVD